ncbi:unnamed protein product [Allacma fusca]|uniref:Uncharacterized protein n=1 Tax=Allacma fusca TaxID=39272 RepID=A0A8J2JKZ5_9HEXA|nr:unnamed protein product [Allacma fusca]
MDQVLTEAIPSISRRNVNGRHWENIRVTEYISTGCNSKDRNSKFAFEETPVIELERNFKLEVIAQLKTFTARSARKNGELTRTNRAGDVHDPNPDDRQ